MIGYFPFVLSLSKHEFSFFSTLLGQKESIGISRPRKKIAAITSFIARDGRCKVS